MRSLGRQECYVCGSGSEPLYSDLEDRLFDAPGTWNMRICKSPRCGLIWLDPMPVEEDIHMAYRNYYTHGATSSPAKPQGMTRLYEGIKAEYWARYYGYERPSTRAWSRIRAHLLALYPGRTDYAGFEVMYLPARRGGRLLDVGCGSGVFLKRMAALGWDVQGVEVDEVAASRARGAGLSVFHGAVEKAPFGDESFDAITMSHVLEHIHRPLDVLRAARRLVKPGGTLSIVTPNSRSWAHRLYGKHCLHLDPPRHLHVFSMPALLDLLGHAGFGSINARTTSHAAHGMFLASRSIQRTGRYRLDTPARLREDIWSRGMELVEWILLKVKPDAGEEIVCIATK